jgi:hypothetical protein
MQEMHYFMELQNNIITKPLNQNKMKTAVEFLLEKYKSQNTLLFGEDFEQAKEMEKQRMYSEEEVLELLLRSKIETANLYYEDMKDWFEQFKKK